MHQTVATSLESPGLSILPRRVVFACLGLMYAAAFVLSPYWRLFEPEAKSYAILALTILLGAIWSYASAGEVRISIRLRSWVVFGIALLGMLVLNHATLTSVIAWRGDESIHIGITNNLIRRIPVQFVIAEAILLPLVVISVVRRSSPLIVASALLEVLAVLWFFGQEPFQGLQTRFLVRYPYVNYWLIGLAPLIATWVWSPRHEFLYRLLPLVGATALIWALERKLSRPSTPVRALWVAATATMPILFYYSSILYLELPAVFLMLVVCFYAERLLKDDFQEMRQVPGWLALVLIGFIKETAIIFLVGFLICRAGFTLHRLTAEYHHDRRPPSGMVLRDELIAAFCVLYPWALYIIFRMVLGSTRDYAPDFSKLLDVSVYSTIGRSFIEQFGIFLPLFIGGLLLLTRKRQFRSASFMFVLFLAVPLFFGIDTEARDSVTLSYAGYSRFNLFVLPAILVGAAALINAISKRAMIVSAGIASVAIALNLAMSPINVDGTKVPYWGNYLVDTSEHYYPYDEALLWLRNEYGHERILFSGMNYRYPLDFYFGKYDWHPAFDVHLVPGEPDENAALLQVLAEAEQQNYDLVLWQVRGNQIPQRSASGRFCQLKEFRNQAHRLLLFSALGTCEHASSSVYDLAARFR